MWSLALSSLRFRWLSFIGIFVTVMAAATLVTATGSLLEGGIRGAVPPERLAGADIVVAADQDISETRGRGDDKETVGGSVVERVRIPTDLVAQVESVAGVAGVVADVSFPAYVVVDGEQVAGPGGTPSLGHSWSSADATAFRLVEGDAPTGSDEVAIDSSLARRSGLGVGDRTTAVVSGRTVEVTVTGVGDPSGQRSLTEQSAVFFSDAAARSLYAHPDQADLLVVTVEQGCGRGDRRDGARQGPGRPARRPDRRRAGARRVPGLLGVQHPPDRDQRLARRHRPLRGRPRARRHDHPVRAAAAARDRPPPRHRSDPATGAQAPGPRDRHGDPAGCPRRGLARVLARRTPGRGDAGQGSAPRDLPDREGCLATGRRDRGGAGRQPGRRVRRGPAGGPGPARRGAHGVREARQRDRLAACARGSALRRGYGRVVPRGHVGPGLDRTCPGPGDLDGRRGHRRALRTGAGAGSAPASRAPSSGRSPVPVGSSRSPTCGRRSGAWHRR